MEDLRKYKSKCLLKAAFLKLFDTKLYKQISITDICAEAELNRKTFYTNYESVDDLLKDCIADHLSPFFHQCTDCSPRSSYDFFFSMQVYIDFILHDKEFFSRINLNNLANHVMQVWQDLYIKRFSSIPASDLDTALKQELFYSYGMNICWSNLIWVIKHSDQPADTLLASSLECHQYYIDYYHAIYHPQEET